MKVKHGYQEKEVKRILFSKKLGFGFLKQCFPTAQYQLYFNSMYNTTNICSACLNKF